MSRNVNRYLAYIILIWLVSAAFSHYMNSSSGPIYHPPQESSNLFYSVWEKIVPGDISLGARAAIVVDAGTGEVLFAKNQNACLPIASLTKLATVTLFLEGQPALNDAIMILRADLAGAGRTKLLSGESIKLGDCLHLCLMSSDNGAANVLARATGLNRSEFVRKMNALAAELGMKDSHFVDPTGIYAGNISTAADLIRLLKRAYSHETIAKISATKRYQFRAINADITHTLYNTNRLLYSGWHINGGKTGYISQSGYCLALDAYDTSGRRVNAIILGSPSNQYRYRDANKLLAFSGQE